VTHPLKLPNRHISTSNTFYVKASSIGLIVNDNNNKKLFTDPLVQDGGS